MSIRSFPSSLLSTHPPSLCTLSFRNIVSVFFCVSPQKRLFRYRLFFIRTQRMTPRAVFICFTIFLLAQIRKSTSLNSLFWFLNMTELLLNRETNLNVANFNLHIKTYLTNTCLTLIIMKLNNGKQRSYW